MVVSIVSIVIGFLSVIFGPLISAWMERKKEQYVADSKRRKKQQTIARKILKKWLASPSLMETLRSNKQYRNTLLYMANRLDDTNARQTCIDLAGTAEFQANNQQPDDVILQEQRKKAIDLVGAVERGEVL